MMKRILHSCSLFFFAVPAYAQAAASNSGPTAIYALFVVASLPILLNLNRRLRVSRWAAILNFVACVGSAFLGVWVNSMRSNLEIFLSTVTAPLSASEVDELGAVLFKLDALMLSAAFLTLAYGVLCYLGFRPLRNK